MDDSIRSIVTANALCKQVANPGGGLLNILRDIHLDVQRGEALAILGASGSGKSTLLGLLAGLDQPTSGEIELLGHNISQLSEDERAQLRAGRVGFVFQSFQLLPGFTALENVMLPMELCQAENIMARSKQFLSEVGLAERMFHYPEQLSGGEQQRVAIARAFAVNPEIVFADEPTGNLDQLTGTQIIELIFHLRETQHITLVLVTHDIDLANRCDRRIHLSSGRMLKEEHAGLMA